MTGAATPRLAGFTRSAVEDLSATLGDPGWLRDRRLAAWDRFESEPYPDMKHPEWRRIET